MCIKRITNLHKLLIMNNNVITIRLSDEAILAFINLNNKN